MFVLRKGGEMAAIMAVLTTTSESGGFMGQPRRPEPPVGDNETAAYVR